MCLFIYLGVKIYSPIGSLLLTITLYRHPIQTYQILPLRFVSKILKHIISMLIDLVPDSFILPCSIITSKKLYDNGRMGAAASASVSCMSQLGIKH